MTNHRHHHSQAGTRLGLWAAAALLAACGGGGGSGATGGSTGTDAGGGVAIGGTDASGGGLVADTGTGGLTHDQGAGGTPIADAGPDAQSDASQPPPLLDCDGTCAAYDICNGTADTGLSLEDCTSLCQDAGEDPAGRRWRRCVAIANGDCAALTACQPPEPHPIDLTCEQTCALLTSCGLDLPVEACTRLCADNAAVAACGVPLQNGCDQDAFLGCVGQTQDVCAAFCASAPACGFSTAERCNLDCANEFFATDPLAADRAGAVLECIGRAGDNCASANACAASPNGLGRDGFCAQFNACNYQNIYGPCDGLIDAFVGPGEIPPQMAACFAAVFAGGCSEQAAHNLFNCVQGGQGGPDCAAYCHDRALCGELADGETELSCTQDCNLSVVQTGTAVWGPLTACAATSGNCPDFAACELAQSPETRCADACQASAACGNEPDEAACNADCVANFDHFVWQNFISCTANNGGCNGPQQCVHVAPGGCPEMCQRELDCGFVADLPSCIAGCEESGVQDPVFHWSIVACTLTAPACGDLNQGPFPPGPPVPVPVPVPPNAGGAPVDPANAHTVGHCQWDPMSLNAPSLAACHEETLCSGADDAALVACLQSWAAPAIDDATLARLARLGCFGQIRGMFSCDVADACMLPTDPPDCDAYCAAVTACDPNAFDGRCADLCAHDNQVRLRVHETADCVNGAAACDDVLACIAPAAAPEPVDEVALCNAWNACAPAWGPVRFQCADAISIARSQGGQASVQCLLDNLLAACPVQPEDLVFGVCAGGGSVAPPTCVERCAMEAACAVPGDSVEGCYAACARRSAEDPALAYRDGVADHCVAEVGCDAFAACETASSPDVICATHCAALDACGQAGSDPAACLADCDSTFGRGLHVDYVDCVAAADGDCAAIAACPSPTVAWCSKQCDDIATCQGAGVDQRAQCIADCENTYTQNPFGAADQAVCAGLAFGCNMLADGTPGIMDCIYGGAAPQDACVRLCHARTTCADAGGFDTCVETCIDGLPGDDALLVSNASACLIGAAGDCAREQRCLDAAANEPVPCNTVCVQINGCGLQNDVVCNDVCGDRVQSGCVLDAVRRGGECGQIAACVGVAPPAADADCQGLCEREHGCNPALDMFLCERACTPSPDHLGFRRGCEEVSACNALGGCAMLVPRINAACTAPCVDAVTCGAFPDQVSCEENCSGRAAAPTTPDTYAADVQACLTDLGNTCDAASAFSCFRLAGGSCQDACDTLTACFGPSPDCLVGCEGSMAADPVATQAQIQCIEQFLGNGLCDINGAQACAGG